MEVEIKILYSKIKVFNPLMPDGNKKVTHT